MDPKDPFLKHNLNRLEERFRTRYYSSIQKDIKRRKAGKKSHKTTLQSIDHNKQCFEQVRKLRHELLGDKLELELRKKAVMS